MAKKKVVDAAVTADVGVVIQPRVPFDWDAALKTAEENHWKKIRVTVKFREWLMAGKPAKLNAAEAMLKARGLSEAIEAVDTSTPEALAEAAHEVSKNEGLCEFHRRPEKPGIWYPTNNIKAGLKENWSVLGYRQEFRGTRGAFAEGLFVYSAPETPPRDKAELNWIYLGPKPTNIHTSVAHTTGPAGPVSSIKRNEYLERPTISFEVAIANAVVDKIPFQAFADMLCHFGEHGMGACRSQGRGQFDVLKVWEV